MITNNSNLNQTVNTFKNDASEPGKPLFITQNKIMQDLLHKIKLVAKTKATLLITGENGTGKEVLAKLFHYYSNRKNKEIVTINCGAIASELVESELFGHEKGAFTGAHVQKKGCFEIANQGTLFLDEIGEMPLNSQVKLLRAVELGTFRRVGGKEEVQVDVALVSATNKILSDQVKSGSFREDLFYRLNVIELYIPPLRHRREDIQLLIAFYSDYFADFYQTEIIEFNDASIQLLMTYDWPGNVRELKNLIERCVVLSEGKIIKPEHLPVNISRSEAASSARGNSANISFENMIYVPIGTNFEEIEKQVIQQTLKMVGNNKTEAAKILGFARKTLHNKLDKYEAHVLN